MKSDKLVLWIALLVGVLMLLGSGAYLIYSYTSYTGVLEEMNTSKDSIQRIYRDSDPFPTKANIESYENNDLLLRKWFVTILNNLATQQVEIATKSPSSFVSSLSEKKIQLHKLIQDNNIKMPENFDLGFKKYFEPGAPLPAPEDVNRLGQQLYLVERLMKIFCEAKPAEIVSIKREIFEGATKVIEPEEKPSARSRRSRRRNTSDDTPKVNTDVKGMVNPHTGIIKKGELFGKMYFEFIIKAKMMTALDILNKIAAESMFMRVSFVKFSKPDNGVLPVSVIEAQGAADGIELADMSRPERLVSGLDLEKPMNVTIGIEVYRFKKDESQKDQ